LILLPLITIYFRTFQFETPCTMRVFMTLVLLFTLDLSFESMSLKPFNPFLIKRPFESNPLTKHLESWKGPDELKQFDYGSPEWNMALMEYLLTHKGSKQVHYLLGAEVQLHTVFHIITDPIY
jgi:hypothetical protein